MKKRFLSSLLVLAMLFALMPTAIYADILEEDLPTVDAASYVALDGDTHQVLFGKNYDKEIDPQSLVQMMTAVLIIEEGNLNDSVTVPEIPDKANNGNRLYLRKGEKVKLSDLLEGIIIYNANDASVAAAVHMAGDEKDFIDMMNKRAADLGMKNTTFKSVYGAAKGQTTTAADMAILAAHASSLPKYIELAIQPSMEWESEMNQDSILNVNGMQDVDKQAVGLKLNPDNPIHLAASVSKSERTVIGVMLKSGDLNQAYTQMQEVIDLGFSGTSLKKIVTKNQALTTLQFSKNKAVRVAASENYSIITAEGGSSHINSMTVLNNPKLPIKQNDVVGTLKVYDGDKVIHEVSLKAMDSARASINWSMIFLVLLLILCLLTIGYLLLNRVRQPHIPAKNTPQKKHPVSKAANGHSGNTRPAPKKAPQKPPVPTHTQKSPTHKKVPNMLLKSPSKGSDAGRKGLEQRLQEKNSTRRGGR